MKPIDQMLVRRAMIGYLVTQGLPMLSSAIAPDSEYCINTEFDDEENEFTVIFAFNEGLQLIAITVPLIEDPIMTYEVEIVKTVPGATEPQIHTTKEYGLLTADMNKTVTDEDIHRCFDLLVNDVKATITGIPMDTVIVHRAHIG